MSDFDREIVRCLNRFFAQNRIPGFACRPRQFTSAGRTMDVLSDSPDPVYNLAIDCRSIIGRKLYFSQHFHPDRNGIHPVDAITDFLARTGRTGFLAIEFRQGSEKAGKAFLIPWAVVAGQFRQNPGISIDDAGAYIALERSKDGYVLKTL